MNEELFHRAAKEKLYTSVLLYDICRSLSAAINMIAQVFLGRCIYRVQRGCPVPLKFNGHFELPLYGSGPSNVGGQVSVMPIMPPSAGRPIDNIMCAPATGDAVLGLQVYLLMFLAVLQLLYKLRSELKLALILITHDHDLVCEL